MEKPPYLLTRDEFNELLELHAPDTAQSRAVKGSQNKMIARAEHLKYLSYGVHQWLYDKAMQGDQEALFKLEHSYNLYDEVLSKAREEKKFQ